MRQIVGTTKLLIFIKRRATKLLTDIISYLWVKSSHWQYYLPTTTKLLTDITSYCCDNSSLRQYYILDMTKLLGDIISYHYTNTSHCGTTSFHPDSLSYDKITYRHFVLSRATNRRYDINSYLNTTFFHPDSTSHRQYYLPTQRRILLCQNYLPTQRHTYYTNSSHRQNYLLLLRVCDKTSLRHIFYDILSPRHNYLQWATKRRYDNITHQIWQNYWVTRRHTSVQTFALFRRTDKITRCERQNVGTTQLHIRYDILSHRHKVTFL